MLPEYAYGLEDAAPVVYEYYRDEIDRLMASLYRSGATEDEVYDAVFSFVEEKVYRPDYRVTGTDAGFIEAIISYELDTFDYIGDIASFCLEKYGPVPKSGSSNRKGSSRKPSKAKARTASKSVRPKSKASAQPRKANGQFAKKPKGNASRKPKTTNSKSKGARR